VKKKMSKAFCPEKQIKGNPVLDICKYVIFPELKGEPFLIERPEIHLIDGHVSLIC